MDDGTKPDPDANPTPPEAGDDATSSPASTLLTDPDVEVEDPDSDEVVPISEIKEETLRVAQRIVAWSAPLPPAGELAAYEEIEGGFARVIMHDFERRTDLEAEAARFEMTLQDREMALREREQALRVTQSDSDIRVRDAVVSTNRILVLSLPVLAFVALVFGPFDGDAARVWAAAVFLSPFVVIGVVLLLRGRMSDPERDVLRDALPKILDALTRQSGARAGTTVPEHPSLPPVDGAPTPRP